MTSINNENKLTQIQKQKKQKTEGINPLLEIILAIQNQVATARQESVRPENNETKTQLETTIAGVTKTLARETQKTSEKQIQENKEKEEEETTDSVLEAWTKKDATV